VSSQITINIIYRKSSRSQKWVLKVEALKYFLHSLKAKIAIPTFTVAQALTYSLDMDCNKGKVPFCFSVSEQKLMCKQEQNLALSLLALPVRERFGNDVVLILSHILQNVHEMLL
jgi:hypothetical protein